VNCVKWKDVAGNTVGTYCKPFTVKAGSNVTFSDDQLNRVLTITSSGSNGSITSSIPGEFVVDGVTYTTIQAAITAAGTTGSVLIPPNYTGTDVYTNTNKIQILDLRSSSAQGPGRYRGYINMLTDCGLKGDGVTDDGPAIQACIDANVGKHFIFPKMQAANSSTADYFSGQTIYAKGFGVIIEGQTSSFPGSVLGRGTVIKFAAGVTGFAFDDNSVAGSPQSGAIKNLTLLSADNLLSNPMVTPQALIYPSNPGTAFNRTLSTIQRAANVLTVAVNLAGGTEGHTLQVGSLAKIVGVAGDATLNGVCQVATVTYVTTSAQTQNPDGFTCAQIGADAGPFASDGTLVPATTGTSSADGLRVCNTFVTTENVTVQGFGRHGYNGSIINAAGDPRGIGDGCTQSPNGFADNFRITNSNFWYNGGDGIYGKGSDFGAGYGIGNDFYYSGLWGIDDQGQLGNTWISNQATYNHVDINGSTPATRTISTISRTRSGTDSIVTLTFSSAPPVAYRVGNGIFVAGVTDASFNTTAGTAFFVSSVPSSTQVTYVQPGFPADASSSGGTARIAKTAETFVASGLDGGSYKIGTSQNTSTSTSVNNYTEGGQDCKYGGYTLSLSGTAYPGCASEQGWLGHFIGPGTVSGHGSQLSANLEVIANLQDKAHELRLEAGKTAQQNELISFYDYLHVKTWSMQVTPNLTTGVFNIFNGTQQRIALNAPTSNGAAFISAEGAGAKIQFNNLGTGSGTGGFESYSGGATPAVTFSVLGTGVVKHALAISPLVAAATSTGTTALPYLSAIIGPAANTTAQIKCTACTGNRVVEIVGDVTGSISTYLSASDAAVDLASVASAACTSERTVAVTGAAFGDAVDVMAATALEAGSFLTGKVSSSGNIKWQFCNLSGGAIDRASDTYSIRVRK
jgi:hypothetical protein